jgi:tripartite-type tricarboxylate transporter receptor subunit TctC
MGSPGIGTGPHMAGELFKIMAGVNLVHVPYRGGTAAMPDFLAGNIQMMFAVPAQVMEHLKIGELRALAVTTATRWKDLPDLPTINEFLPAYESSNWFGVVGPANIPTEIVEQLNREINAALAEPKIVDRIAGLGNHVLRTSAAEFGKLIVNETEKWATVIRAAHLKAD